MTTTLQEFSDRIVQAAATRTPLCIRGGGSKDWYGQDVQGTVLDTTAYRGITDYEPTELVVSARCGTPLAEIEAHLAQHGQMLAFEPPHFGPGATIGGTVAAGLSGPRRQAAGAVRDFVLGAVLVDGQGQVLHFGGKVMKNVAGYDVSRLLAGSLGVFGLIAEVSLKVLPRPVAECTVQLQITQDDALRRLNEWGGQPLPVSASSWHDGVLTVRLSGARSAVDAARTRIGGEALDDADAWWRALREHEGAFFTDPGGLWRLSLPTVAPSLAAPGTQLIEWGGAQRWLRTDADAGAIRAAAARAGGHATLFRGGDRRAGVFQPLAPAVHAIHRQLKNAFDPAGVFNRGRMYKDF
ncbi:glycolate oxidase subunit GlcE [Massilia rhizosphaerae]|uniref:glycolate oxidase subunit GlcE n=1 Tax=Massilia rhizosphaerae TaxID=2784389 RepID=UPI0018DD47C3|nr:glycolate oxidase subunit GlcE [Massilia rhizosphaerae]